MLLAAASCLFGCAKPTVMTDGAVEAEENNTLYACNAQAIRSGDKLYFIDEGQKGAMLFCTDIESGTTMPICTRPECLHENSECDSYIGMSAPSAMIINGNRFYWPMSAENVYPPEKYLFSMALDGTDRRRELKLDADIEMLANNGIMTIYNNTLYRCGNGELIEDATPKRYIVIYSQKIENGSEPQEILRLEGGDEITRFDTIVARRYGSMMYCGVFFYEDVSEDETEIELQLYAYDLEKSELKELHSGKVDFGAVDLSVRGDKLIFAGGEAFSYSLTSGEFEKYIRQSDRIYAITDGAIFGFTSTNDYICMDHSGNTISEGPFVTEGLEANTLKRYLGSIDSAFYFYLKSPPGVETPYNYLVSFDPKTSEIKLLWKGENKGRQW